MSRASAQKRIHYVRAVFPRNTRAPDLEQSLRDALNAMRNVRRTEIELPQLGTFAVRQRDIGQQFIRLAIGGGVPREAMSTIGLGVVTAIDSDEAESPPTNRAFKQADAFCLVEDNDVLVCTDGHMRVTTLETYLRRLLATANAGINARNFQLVARINTDTRRTLELEGIKEIQVNAAAYAIGDGNDDDQGNWLTRGFRSLVRQVRDGLEHEAKDDAEREAIADHWAEINVCATVKVSGGSRGEPIMVRSLEDAARQAFDDMPDGAEITVLTKKGNPVTPDSLTLGTSASIKRIRGQNDLDSGSAWDKLEAFRSELRRTRRWQT